MPAPEDIRQVRGQTCMYTFFSIAFYSTNIPWFTLALGDLAVKLIVALIMLIPFRLLISKVNSFADLKIKNLNY